jgi:hypothetical protein
MYSISVGEIRHRKEKEMSRWTAGSWRRACARSAQRNVRMEVKAWLESDSVILKAELVTVRGMEEYHISLWRKDSDHGDIFEVFRNKDEANQMFLTLKRKFF